jgi:hypothetical protein
MRASNVTVLGVIAGVAFSASAVAEEADTGWQWYYSAGIPFTNLDTASLGEAAAAQGLVIADEVGEVAVGGQGTLGVMVTSRFGAEIRYSASANANGSTVIIEPRQPATVSAETSIDGITVYGVGRYPVNEKTDILGKIGFTFQDLDAEANLAGTVVNLDDEDEGVAAAVGVRWRTGERWAVTAEMEYLAVDFDDALDEPYRGSFNIEYMF